MIWLYLFLAFLTGMFIPMQAGANSQLARRLGHPVFAALVSFSVGLISLLAYMLATRPPLPSVDALWRAPWWVWTGGLLGASAVVVVAAFAPKLGAATFISVMLAGQVIASLALDHFGLAGFDVRPATLWRLVGASLVICGVVLVRKF